MADREWVAFSGPYEWREITADQWRRAGVDHDTVRWDATNNWRVSRDDLDLNGEQFFRLITSDPFFSTVTGERGTAPVGARYPSPA